MHLSGSHIMDCFQQGGTVGIGVPLLGVKGDRRLETAHGDCRAERRNLASEVPVDFSVLCNAAVDQRVTRRDDPVVNPFFVHLVPPFFCQASLVILTKP